MQFPLDWLQFGSEVESDPFQFRHLSSDYSSEDTFQRSLFEQIIVWSVVHIALPQSNHSKITSLYTSSTFER